MSQTDYEDYYPKALQNLALEVARATQISPEETLPSAGKCFESLLPEGSLNTADQYLYHILADERKVGVLWFGVKKDRAIPEAYVWDIAIEASETGKGYGKQAMLALEKEVKAVGISRISLSVFAHNATARNLYERLGYGAVSSVMLKCF